MSGVKAWVIAWNEIIDPHGVFYTDKQDAEKDFVARGNSPERFSAIVPVTILTDAELAARDAQIRAEALEAAAQVARECYGYWLEEAGDAYHHNAAIQSAAKSRAANEVALAIRALVNDSTSRRH